MQDNFSMDWGRKQWFWDNLSTLHLLLTLSLLMHQLNLRSSGIRSQRLGTPVLRSQIQLGSFPLLSFFSKLPATKQTTFCDDKHGSCHTGQQEPDDIQRVVLEPGEVVGGWPQVLGSFVAHDKLDPEDCSVQGLHRLIMLNG